MFRSTVQVLGVMVLAASPAVALPTATSEPWHRIESPHFIVLGNSDPSTLAAVAENLERLIEVLDQTTSGLQVAPRLPTYVYAFRDRSSAAPYLPRRGGSSQALDGYFIGTTEANFIVIGVERAEVLRVANHEYLHAVVFATLPEIPLWITEGLAEFYSTFRTTRSSADVGRAVPHHLAWLASYPLVSLDRILTTGVESPDYNESDRQGTFYAQSWAMTHYFIHGSDDPRRFAGLLTRLGRGEPPLTAFQRAFEVERADELLDKLKAYVSSPRMSYRTLTFSSAFEPLESKAVRIDRAETLLRLGDLLASHAEGQEAAAEEHLAESAQLAPDDPESRALLGALADRRGEVARAEEWYARAFEVNQGRARPYYVAGRARLERFFRGGVDRLPDKPPQLLLEARELLRRSLDLEPDQPEALASYGKTFTLERNPPVEGTAALLDAAAALPRRSDVLLDLVLVYAHAGRIEAARNVLQRHLDPRGKAAEIRVASLAIVDAEIGRARALANEGRSAAAESLLARAVEQAGHPEARRVAEEVRTSLATHARRDAAIDLYNRGVAAANGRDLAGALTWFRRARDEADDDQLRREAVARIREVEHRIQVEEGLGLVRKGRLAEARRVFEAVLRDSPDPETRKAVEGYLRDLRAASSSGR